MRRSRWLALGAVMAVLGAAPAALAQDESRRAPSLRPPEVGAAATVPDAAPPGTTAAKTTAAKTAARKGAAGGAKRPGTATRGTARKRAAVPPAPAAAEAYQLVPNQTGSALVRARQNAFGVRDEEGSSSGVRSRHIGIGLGGGNGTTPGMAIGF